MKLEELERMEAEAEALMAQQTGQAPEGEPTDKQEQNVEGPEKTGEEPPKEAEIVEVDPQEPAAEDKADDAVSDGLTLDNAREQLLNAEANRKGMQANMTKATQEAAELRKSNESMKAELDALKETVEQLKQSSVKTEKPAEPDRLSQFREQYGEEFQPVVEGITKANEQVSSVDSKVNKLAEELKTLRKEKEAAELEAAWNKHWGTVKAAHPDADNIVVSEDYKGWLLRQPEYVQKADADGSTNDVIHVFKLYKGSQKQDQPSKDASSNLLDKAKEAAEPSVDSVQTAPNDNDEVPWFSEAEIRSMTPMEFAGKESLIEQAAAMGRIR